MEIVSAEAMDRGRPCQRPCRGRSRRPRPRPNPKPRRSSSTVRGKRRGAPVVNVSGRRRVCVEEMPAEANRGNVMDHVADANGLGPPNAAHDEGEDFVCDLLDVFPEPTANMILPPIPSPSEEIHLPIHDQ